MNTSAEFSDQVWPSVHREWTINRAAGTVTHKSGLELARIADAALGFRIKVSGIESLVNTVWDDKVTALVNRGMGLLSPIPDFQPSPRRRTAQSAPTIRRRLGARG